MKTAWLLGVDEVGRGPLAGPVGVGVALVPAAFDWGQLPGVTDSKKLSAKKRELIVAQAAALQAASALFCAVALVSAQQIDRQGIVPAINTAMQQALNEVSKSVPRPGLGQAYERVQVLLDGGLKAPTHFTKQETIIKGDAKEPAIGLASIVAKVHRDRYMERIGERAGYEQYGFAAHKGYGTQAHRAAIAQYGLSPEHRASYCRNIEIIV